jgi:hypothetical protein
MAADPNLQRARAGLVGCAALLAGVLLAAVVIWGVVRGAQSGRGRVVFVVATDDSYGFESADCGGSDPEVAAAKLLFTMDKIVTGEKIARFSRTSWPVIDC